MSAPDWSLGDRATTGLRICGDCGKHYDGCYGDTACQSCREIAGRFREYIGVIRAFRILLAERNAHHRAFGRDPGGSPVLTAAVPDRERG